ncbi:MAG: YdbH domain-containing protein [Pseudomonadota bacterium]
MRSKKIIYGVVLLCSGIIIFLLLAFINLPGIVAGQAKQYLPKLLNSDPIDINIQRIGFSHFHISDIHLASGISIDSIDLGYSIQGFSSVKLKTLTISGLTIQAGLDQNNKVSIQGFEFPKASEQGSQSPDLKIDLKSGLTFLPEKIVLKNSQLVLKGFGEDILIPFDALSTLNSTDGKIVVQGMMVPYGQKIRTHLQYQLGKGIQLIEVEGKSFDLALVNRFVSKKSDGVVFHGMSDIKIETRSPQKEYKLNVSKVSLAAPVDIAIEQVVATLKLEDKKIDIQGSFGLSHQMLSPIRMSYGASIDLSQNNAKFNLMVNGFGVQSDMGDVKFAKCNISGRVGLDKHSQLSGDGWVNASNGKIVSEKYKVQASGMNFSIPFSFPDANKKVSGSFSVPVMSYQNQYQGSTSGKIVQTGLKQFKINGMLNYKPLPGFIANYASTIGFEKGLNTALDFDVQPFKITDKDIKTMTGSLPENAVIEATFSARGKIAVHNHQADTSLEMIIKDGQVQLPDNHVKAVGIHTNLNMADLLTFRSRSGQILTIDSIDIDKVKIKDARVRFSIEDKNSFLLENLRFKWCNGLVSSESIRFPQKNNQYLLTLYCDRLEMPQLLQQLGAFHSEGNGTLNGRIPVTYSDGNISFDNGFLFSTPGSGGRVAIKNTEKLTAGIPLDSPQFSQLDLAQEALKDFDYKWAKLQLNTVGNTLAVAMELDGKPSKTMPFKYEKEFGGFIRVDAASPGSNFQGIKLDVNLKLPFNEVMKFDNNIKSLLKQ